MAKTSENKELISKEVVESYIFSTVRHDFGIYSERLLLRLVELAQCEINGLDFKGGTAFLIGNEGNGLKEETAQAADVYMKIPMQGQVESLNAAVASVILMYEAARQRMV